MTNTPFNAYDLLDISPEASTHEIKKAFRDKAMEFHPDKHNNAKPATILFKILVQAKETLLDPERRLEHDYAHGIKTRPKAFEETIYRSESEPKTDWASLLLAGVAGLAIGASISSRRRKKKS